jgi:uncharacterized protein
MRPVDAPASTRIGRFWRHPATWFWFAPILIFVQALFVGPATEAGPVTALVLTGASAVVVTGLYLLVMRRVAHRRTPELGLRAAVPELLRGATVGAGFVLVSLLAVVALGGYRFTAGADDVVVVVLTAVVGSFAGAVAEELAFRGIGLQAAERVGGTWFAIVVTSLLFGFAHAFNPGASLWSSFAITVEAGVLLGAAFVWRRNLWFAIGVHAAWNTLEGVLGVPVSGHHEAGLVGVAVDGPTWLTGGDFGLEGSVVPVVLSIALAVPMLVAAKRRGNLRPRASVVRRDQAGAVRVDDGLDPVAQVELGEDARDEGLDGLAADHQLVGDLRVGQSARE